MRLQHPAPPRPVIPIRFRGLLRGAALVVGAALAATSGGCAQPIFIPGTRVVDTKLNRELVAVCEKYRHALEDRDAETLLSLAAPSYFEDSGTPRADDDYGYDGLKTVINARLASLKTIRFDIQYRGVTVESRHAKVDIRFDASYQIATDMGDRWERKQNEKRLELENENGKWRFTGGL